MVIPLCLKRSILKYDVNSCF